jgi:hypothetical protein
MAKQLDRKIRRTEKLVTPPLYVDSVRIQASGFGFKITFSSVTDASDEAIDMDDYVVIGMSPEHAASLYKMLGEHLSAFQQGAGPLRNASDLTPLDNADGQNGA